MIECGRRAYLNEPANDSSMKKNFGRRLESARSSLCQLWQWAVKKPLTWLLSILSNINIQLALLTVAALAFGFTMSVRLAYVHSFRAFDMNAYSYAKLARTEDSWQRQKVYQEIAKENLEQSEVRRKLAARSTDMVTASLWAIIAASVAIIITTLLGNIKQSPRCRKVLAWAGSPFVIISMIFIIMVYPLWLWPESLTWLRRDPMPGVHREQQRATAIQQLICDTDYLLEVVPENKECAENRVAPD